MYTCYSYIKYNKQIPIVCISYIVYYFVLQTTKSLKVAIIISQTFMNDRISYAKQLNII